jgi:hypothetical protein
MINHSTNILEMTNMLFKSFRFIHLCMFELNMSLMESQSAAIVFRDFVKVMVYPNRWRLWLIWKSCFGLCCLAILSPSLRCLVKAFVSLLLCQLL